MASSNSNFFTGAAAPHYVVPHAVVGERYLMMIHEAIKAAFAIIRERGFDLRNAGENTITNELERVLVNDVWNREVIEGFNRQFFGKISRGSEVENFNGQKVSKKPDLVFPLQRDNILWELRQDAIFAECKPVGQQHSLISNYCGVGTDRTGIERFVMGDYAWAMHESIMIGYVRDGFHIQPHLAECLFLPSRHGRLGSSTAPVAAIGNGASPEALHWTVHQRLFRWKENGMTATAITIYHSWHDCGQPPQG